MGAIFRGFHFQVLQKDNRFALMKFESLATQNAVLRSLLQQMLGWGKGGHADEQCPPWAQEWRVGRDADAETTPQTSCNYRQFTCTSASRCAKGSHIIGLNPVSPVFMDGRPEVVSYV